MQPPPTPPERHGVWWGMWPGLAGMALAGSSVAVIAATQQLPALWVQSVRYGVAVLAVILLARMCRVRLGIPGRADIGWVVGGALCGQVGFNLAVIVGTRHAEPALFGAAVACVPVALAILGPLTQHRRPARRVVLGACVVTSGTVIATGWGHGDAVGLLLAASLIVCEVGFTLCGARVLPRMGVWSYSASTCAVSALAFAGFAGFPGLGISASGGHAFATFEAIGAILYLGVVATAISFVCWFTGVERLGPSTVGLCAGSAAPATALLSVLLGGPVPSLGTWAGIVVIVVGLGIGFRPSRTDGSRLRRRVSNVPVRP